MENVEITDVEVKQYWEDNAESWYMLAKAGHDIYRDYLNTPSFLLKLPDVSGLEGIDIGCGDGHNTRILHDRGAIMTGIDISEKFIKIAKRNTSENTINFLPCNAIQTPFSDHSFDFATGFMSFMDIYNINLLFKEINRILKPNGFVQFSISHPCFNPLHRTNLRNSQGNVYAIELGKYSQEENIVIEQWIFSTIPDSLKNTLNPFKIPRFIRSLSYWFNTITESPFVIEMINEPMPDEQIIKIAPKLIDATIIPYFLHVRCRKLNQ